MRIFIASEMRVVNRNLSGPMSSKGTSKQQQVDATPKVPRGLRGLPPPSTVSPTSELERLKADAAALEAWWKDPRWNQTKREYSGKIMKL